jgi:alkaline phosphatase D
MKKMMYLLVILGLTAVGCSSVQKNEKSSDNSAPKEIILKTLDPNLPVSQIAFGSCFDQDKPASIWQSIYQANPHLYLGLGDNIYASRKEQQPIADQYAKLKNHEYFVRLAESVPMLSTWDDHDFGFNDGGKNNPLLAEAKSAYLSFFKNDAQLITHQNSGIEHSTILGTEGQKVQIIALDTRSYRGNLQPTSSPGPGKEKYEPSSDTTQPILGDDQWKWLESELSKKADLRIVLSSIQLLAEGHGYERWGLLPHEQKRFEKLIAKKKVKNVIVLSGDRHIAEVFKKNVGPGIDLWEVTSSALNRASNIVDEPEKMRQGKLYSAVNFGFIDIDWANAKAVVSLRDANGASLESHDIKLTLKDDLKIKSKKSAK